MKLESAKLLKNNILFMINTRVKEINELRKHFNELEKYIDSYPQNTVNDGDKKDHKENKSKTYNNSTKEEVAAGAYRIIKMRGEPIKRKELYNLLIEDGFIIEGKNPEMILSTMLWRVKDSGLTRLNDAGYWLKNEKYAPANYSPEEQVLQS